MRVAPKSIEHFRSYSKPSHPGLRPLRGTLYPLASLSRPHLRAQRQGLVGPSSLLQLLEQCLELAQIADSVPDVGDMLAC